MKEEKNTSSFRYVIVDPFVVSFAILLTAKLWGKTEVSWLWIFSPLWIPLGGVIILTGFMLLLYGITKWAVSIPKEIPQQKDGDTIQ